MATVILTASLFKATTSSREIVEVMFEDGEIYFISPSEYQSLVPAHQYQTVMGIETMAERVLTTALCANTVVPDMLNEMGDDVKLLLFTKYPCTTLLQDVVSIKTTTLYLANDMSITGFEGERRYYSNGKLPHGINMCFDKRTLDEYKYRYSELLATLTEKDRLLVKAYVKMGNQSHINNKEDENYIRKVKDVFGSSYWKYLLKITKPTIKQKIMLYKKGITLR